MLPCSGCRLFRAPVPACRLGDLKKATDLNLLPAERGRLHFNPVDPMSEGPQRRRSHNLLDDLFQFLATRKFSLLLTSIHGPRITSVFSGLECRLFCFILLWLGCVCLLSGMTPPWPDPRGVTHASMPLGHLFPFSLTFSFLGSLHCFILICLSHL